MKLYIKGNARIINRKLNNVEEPVRGLDVSIFFDILKKEKTQRKKWMRNTGMKE